MWTSPEAHLFILGLGFLEHIVILQSKGLLGCVVVTIEGVDQVSPGVLTVQVLLESSALTRPGLTPEGAHKSKGLVEDRVHLEDGNGNEFKNLLHNT